MTARVSISKLNPLISQHLKAAYNAVNGSREKVANFANYNIGTFCAPFVMAGAGYGAYKGKQFLDRNPVEPVQWLPVFSVAGGLTGLAAGVASAIAVFSPMKTAFGAAALYSVVKATAYINDWNAERARSVK